MALSESNRDEALQQLDSAWFDVELCGCGRPFNHFKGFDPVLCRDVCFECWIERLSSME
jgi:hypothetical protein